MMSPHMSQSTSDRKMISVKSAHQSTKRPELKISYNAGNGNPHMSTASDGKDLAASIVLEDLSKKFNGG